MPAIPGYGFAEHKGYSTLAHSTALHELGPSESTGIRSQRAQGRDTQ